MQMSPAKLGAICASISVIFFSINDVAIKFLSGGYALHQVVLIRSVIGLLIIVAVIAPMTTGWAIARTKKLKMHMLRGLCVVFANMTFFLGLAAMPLADAVAIFFISPLVITLFSVLFLGEVVGPRRWAAIAVGFIGVVVMMRPGTQAFQVASLLPLAAAFCYAGIHIITRRIGGTESAATMAFYIQLMFIVVGVMFGLFVGDGRFGDQSDPSLAFLLRAWSWPVVADYPIFLIIGVGIGIGTVVGAGSGTVVGAGTGVAVGAAVGVTVGVAVVGTAVGWSNTSPAATHRWSEYGALKSWKCPPTCVGRRWTALRAADMKVFVFHPAILTFVPRR